MLHREKWLRILCSAKGKMLEKNGLIVLDNQVEACARFRITYIS